MAIRGTKMEITTTMHDTVTVLTVTGRVDAMTAGSLETALNNLIAGGSRKIILDFTGLVYISSGGLRVLLATAKTLHNETDRFALSGLSHDVQKIMRLAGFTAIFAIYTTVQEASAALQGSPGS
jgi:anti-sigma B factor antagonist